MASSNSNVKHFPIHQILENIHGLVQYGGSWCTHRDIILALGKNLEVLKPQLKVIDIFISIHVLYSPCWSWPTADWIAVVV